MGKLAAAALAGTLMFQSFALQAADTSNPNQVPFSGVVTRLDQPSDGAPGGSFGRKVIIPSAAAAEMVETLVYMPVNLAFGMSSHSQRDIVGVITKSWLEGSEWHVSGYLYGKNVPEQVDKIKAEKDSLGMSIEITNITWENVFARVLVMQSGTATGAAILYKNRAAFQTTSLAASKSSEVKPMEGILAQILAAMEAMKANQSNFAANLDKAIVGLTTSFAQVATAMTAAADAIKAANAVQAQATAAPAQPAAPVAPAAPAGGQMQAGADPQQTFYAMLGQAMLGQMQAGNDQAQQNPAMQLLALLAKPNQMQAGAVPTQKTLPADVQTFLSQYSGDLKANSDGKYTIPEINAAMEKAKEANLFDINRAAGVKDWLLRNNMLVS